MQSEMATPHSDVLNMLPDALNPKKKIVAMAKRTTYKIKKGRSLTGDIDKLETEKFEQDLLQNESHALTKSEVVGVLINQHLNKYKKFVFTSRQAMSDSCWSWMVGCFCLRKYFFRDRKKEKFHILYKTGTNRLKHILDVRSLAR